MSLSTDVPTVVQAFQEKGGLNKSVSALTVEQRENKTLANTVRSAARKSLNLRAFIIARKRLL